jgi:hypothetical protein
MVTGQDLRRGKVLWDNLWVGLKEAGQGAGGTRTLRFTNFAPAL